MLIIGLTGSMGTGKSTLLQQIQRNLRWPIWDADAHVKKLYQHPPIIEQILEIFPTVGEKKPHGWHINRINLKQELHKNPSGLGLLENILHPALGIHRTNFLRTMRLYQQKTVVLDVPLLFEKGIDALCDITIVTHCPEWLQKKRILQRPGMTVDFMAYLLSHQIPIAQKKKLAHINIETGLNKHHSWMSFCEQITLIDEYTIPEWYSERNDENKRSSIRH